MKEELIRVLNTKLGDIDSNIDALVELNGKIDKEKEDLAYTNRILDLFKENEKYSVLNFTKLDRENFDKVLEIVGTNLAESFSTNSCNYDGLIYLINGINNGVSLSLTMEQENAINYLIQEVERKTESHEAVIDGLVLVKAQFPIEDVEILREKHNNFERIVQKLLNEDYVSETAEIEEAMSYSELENDKVIDILKYLLNYNADVYASGKGGYTPEYVSEEVSGVKEDIPLPEDNIDLPVYEPIDVTEEKSEIEIGNEEEPKEEFHFPEFDSIDAKKEEDAELTINPPEDNFTFEEYNVSMDDETSEKVEEKVETPVQEKRSTREIKRLFSDYDFKFENAELNAFVDGDLDNYKKILEVIKNNRMTKELEKNHELVKEILLSSSAEAINDVLKIIQEDLSVDDDDYVMTLKIAINTLPTIFVQDGGNYENFVKNVQFFKELGINLVNLFDFSKEVFIANHDEVLKNYNVVRNYNVNLDYKNLKYMLLLPNIGEKLDYYVESVYPDRTKNNEKFDGIAYINNYPNKLNIVKDETIKRLRFSSENSKKVFGNKPSSLAGEITNLKVNALEIPESYLNNFFDNKFEELTEDEVREYAKLTRNSSNIGNYTNEIAYLETFHNGLRYTINNVNISYNKVIRNYNTLRSYNIDKKKALLFAVCYNLVITNDEYKELKKTLEERDGE